MIYKKDIVNKIMIGTLLAFIIFLISMHILINPFGIVETKLEIVEKNIVSKNWDEVNDALNDIDTLWQKYEIVMRVLNNKSVSDDFILHLDQCKLLSKYKKDNALEYLSILKDDIKDMMNVIPNP